MDDAKSDEGQSMPGLTVKKDFKRAGRPAKYGLR